MRTDRPSSRPPACQRPLALLVSGPPGSGKTTVGQALASALPAAVLDLDTATAAMTAVLGEVLGTTDLDDEHFARVTRTARYETLTALAEDNLAAGVNVVMIAPFTRERGDVIAWEQMRGRLTSCGGNPVLIWLRITSEEVARRVRQRAAERDQSKLTHSRQWAAALDLHPPVGPHVAVEATQAPEQILRGLLADLAEVSGR